MSSVRNLSFSLNRHLDYYRGGIYYGLTILGLTGLFIQGFIGWSEFLNNLVGYLGGYSIPVGSALLCFYVGFQDFK